jgi:hypothetical protein
MYSETINIYVDSDESIETFVSEFERAFGIQLNANLQHTHGFSYADTDQWLVVHEQPDFRALEDDVADFPYWIEVGSYSPRYSERLTYANDFAQLIYEKLKASHRYRFLMMADAELTLEQVEGSYRRAG